MRICLVLKEFVASEIALVSEDQGLLETTFRDYLEIGILKTQPILLRFRHYAL
jgi:hypothetical protein